MEERLLKLFDEIIAAGKSGAPKLIGEAWQIVHEFALYLAASSLSIIFLYLAAIFGIIYAVRFIFKAQDSLTKVFSKEEYVLTCILSSIVATLIIILLGIFMTKHVDVAAHALFSPKTAVYKYLLKPKPSTKPCGGCNGN